MKTGKMIKVSSIPWVVIVLAFVLLYAAYFLLYIPQQESLVEKRAFRVLKEYAGNMLDKLDYYETHLRNYSPYYSIDYLSKNDTTSSGDLLELAIKKNTQVETLIANLEKTIYSADSKATSNLGQIIYDNGQYVIRFKGVNANEVEIVLNKLIQDTLTRRSFASKIISLDHKLPMTTFMENLKFDRLLNNIALFSDSAAIYNTNLEVIQDITNPGSLADTVNKLQGGLIARINIRGEDHRVMVLPFQFLGSRLYLAGFISTSDFRHITRDINNQFLITLAGVLLLLLFGMPILKIVFISRKEQLHANDGTASIISLIFGIGFLILIILSVMKQYVVDRQNLKNRIVHISETLSNHVNSDIENIKTLFQDFHDRSKPPTSNKALVRTVQNTFIEKEPHNPLLIFKKMQPSHIAKIPDNYMRKELPLNEVFLIGDDGILMKIVSRTGAASLVPVDLSHRNYFKNVTMNSHECWTYKNVLGQSQPYFVESIKSYNSGKKEVAFSFRLQQAQASQFGANILAITSPLPTLYKQVLPEDVSFLIMNNQGDVLFHSDQSKNLHENFLNECDENTRLRGAMNHRVTDIVNIDYNEKDWLARIVPVKDAPLFHITLVDLGFTHNKNARILFYTFYFTIATFILILLGIGIIYLIRMNRDHSSSKTWIFDWLLYRPEYHKSYIFLLIVQSILFVFQLLGLLINDKPVTSFIYQTIFIIFSAFAALIILGNVQHRNPGQRFNLLNLPQSLFFVFLLIFTIILVWIHQKHALLYPVAVIIVMSLVISRVAKMYLQKEQNKTSKNINLSEVRTLHDENARSGRKLFQLYVFTWLLCISAVPTIQYYHSVKMQENNLWKRDMLEYAAMKNLELDVAFTAEMRESGWYKKITGDGIDFLKINHEDKMDTTGANKELARADWFYTLLPDPVTKGNHLVGLLRNSNYQNEWYREQSENDAINRRIDDDILYYSQAGMEGQMRVEQCDNYRLGVGQWLLYFTLPILLVVAFLWFLFRYVAQSVLRTIALDWKSPEEGNLETVLGKKDRNHIMLISLNGAEYYKKAEEFLKKKANPGEQPSVPKKLYADNLPDVNKIEPDNELLHAEIVWIKGLDELIKDPKKFGEQFPKLKALCGKVTGKLVVELPFGHDFIREYYDELNNESAPDKTVAVLLRSTHQKLETFFRDFYKYTGTLIHEPDETAASLCKSGESKENEIVKDSKPSEYFGLEPRYRYFWNNFTSLEKLILTDISEDGMLNYKNKQLINQLKMKGLITFTPYPRIYSEGFSHFLSEVIDPEETHELQSNMRKQGNWHSLRYLILLILIPLIIFILIAQGTSIEKVIAIATGGLAVFSGIVRLFESDFLRLVSKAK